MALGFTLSDKTTKVLPDKSLTRRSAPKVLIAAFGDGYEQRLADGINNIKQSYDIAFVNRPVSEIDSIVAFFDEMRGVTAFEFTIPDTRSQTGETSIKVVCETYDLVYSNSIASGCVANFRRVYE